MKIAVWHNLPSGGGKRALYYHVKGLVERGHIVESWCPSTADQSYLPLSGLITEHIVPLYWKSISVTSSLPARLKWVFHDMHHNLEAMDEHCRRCADEINSGGFDLLFANSSVFIAVAPIARYVKIPKVLYLQEPNRPLYEARPKWPWIPYELPTGIWRKPAEIIEYARDISRIRYMKAVAQQEGHNILAYNTVLVNSFFSRESMVRIYGINARVCYLGIDTDLFVDRQQLRDSFVVGVGSFTPSKNIEFVIKAMACVGDPRPRLIWIGDQTMPAYLDGLKKLAQSLHVDFEAREMVSDSELLEVLNRAAMMVYAPRLEPFGYAPLEANACGLPVVAVAEGGVRETVVDGINGLLVEPDETEMARAIERLRDNKKLANKLGQNGRNFVSEKWSLKASIDRIVQQLEKVNDKKSADCPSASVLKNS